MSLINKTKIKMGMVGGGKGAFIGAIHRLAAALDGDIELVCGAFSSNAKRSVESGLALHLNESRCYESYQQMFSQECLLPDDQRMDFVVIVTPNHLHFPVAKMALESGFHVMSDKPATISLSQALLLQTVVEKTGQLYGLTHTYTGYPLIKQAQHLVKSGQLGNIVKVVVEYSQGWLAEKNNADNKQASWRLDPNTSGISCCIGDIGVHAANLAEYVTGHNISEICSELTSTVANRQLDDDGMIMLKFENGSKGILLSSQICVGDENNLRLRVYGDKASLDWSQLDPNSMWLRSNHAPAQLIRTGWGTDMCDAALNAIRTPAGHPEGYIEAFANLYKNFAAQIYAFKQNHPASNQLFDVPDINDAVRGMAFIENAVAANKSTKKWHSITFDTDVLAQLLAKD